MATRTRRAPAVEPRTAPLRVLPGGGRRLRSALVPAAVVLVLAVFAVAGLQAYLSQEGFRAARLERQLRAAEEEHKLLRAKVAELSSPSRLQDAATALGMEPATDPTFLKVPETPGQGAATRTGPAPYASKRLYTTDP